MPEYHFKKYLCKWTLAWSDNLWETENTETGITSLDYVTSVDVWSNIIAMESTSPAYEPAVDLWSNTNAMEIPSTYSPSLVLIYSKSFNLLTMKRQWTYGIHACIRHRMTRMLGNPLGSPWQPRNHKQTVYSVFKRI